MSDDLVLRLLEKIESLEKKLEKKELEPIVYETKELAQVLGMSKNNAGLLMAQRNFPSFKLGGKWKVEKKALDEWLLHNRYHEIELV